MAAGLSKKVRENLKKHSQLQDCLCLECGYSGLMGVHSVEKNSQGKKMALFLGFGFIFVTVFLLPGGFFLGAVLGVALAFGVERKFPEKKFLECPNCVQIIGPIK